MNAGTRFVANVNRISTSVPTSDARFDMRLTEKFDDEESDDKGWTWVAAILIGGVLIASGYLEQESANFERAATQTPDQRHATNVPASHIVAVGTKRADKGY
ncbi:MAG: hypothetical protein LH481_09515 [Burkholderiales bacterium]|nr:hypothetical protein [Burkholderiales bacterium]